MYVHAYLLRKDVIWKCKELTHILSTCNVKSQSLCPEVLTEIKDIHEATICDQKFSKDVNKNRKTKEFNQMNEWLNFFKCQRV